MNQNQDKFTDEELSVLAQESKMQEDEAELAENARNGRNCLLLLGGLFLFIIILCGLIKH